MDRQERLAQAGHWLLREREQRQLSVRQLAAKIDVTTQVVYDWQNGKNAVSDDKAERIAQAFGMDVVEVRRNLGLWVPAERGDDGTWSPSPELQEALDRMRRSREEFLEEAKRVEKLLTDHAQRPEAPSEHAATDRDEEEAERRRGA